MMGCVGYRGRSFHGRGVFRLTESAVVKESDSLEIVRCGLSPVFD